MPGLPGLHQGLLGFLSAGVAGLAPRVARVFKVPGLPGLHRGLLGFLKCRGCRACTEGCSDFWSAGVAGLAPRVSRIFS